MQRFQQAGLEAAGQRRTVTVLFVDISGYTGLSGQLENEDLYTLIRQTMEALAQAVYKFDGVVDKFTGDGLMALFGAPIAHENNAELAVRAALEMQAAAARLSAGVRQRFDTDLHLHIGLHSGPVIVGGIGSNLMMNYTAIGDTVNLARRLEEAAARGTIVVSESVCQQTRAVVDYEPTPPLALKGFPLPLPGFRVVGLKAHPGLVRGLEGRRAPLIGRDAEFNRLKKAVTALVTQQTGQFVMITGDGGIGKSRLTSELKSLITGSAVRVAEGHSLTYRRTVSYWTFLEAFRNYLEVPPEAPEAQVRVVLERQAAEVLGPAAAEALPYLENWLSLTPSDPAAAERLQYLDAGQLRRQMFIAVRDLLVAAARRQPLWLILEDLHWADDASLELLQFLLESVPQAPLLIYVLSRPFGDGLLSRVMARARERLGERFLEVALTSLSPDQSERLLFQLLPMAEFPARWLEAILQRAAGIPYYLEEILRMLLDHGVIQRADGRWHLTPGADPEALAVPETLQALILARFDRLGPAERRVLQAASVIGRQFSVPLLLSVLAPLSEAELYPALDHLVEREFVLPPAGGAGDEYNFRHVLVSDAIYSTLLRRSQSELHGQVGEALEQVYADQIDKHVEILARHYAFSPRAERALHYLILAGQKAARAYLNDQARQHYEQALGLLPQVHHSIAQAVQVNMGLGDVLAFAGEYGTARLQYQAALDSIPAPAAMALAAERSELFRKLGAAHLKQSDYEQALGAFTAAQTALAQADQPSPIAAARILNDIGWTHFEQGDLEAAHQTLGQGLALVEGAPALDVISSLYNRLGAVAYRRGDWAAAADCVRHSVGIRESIGDLAGSAGSLANLGLLDIALGDLDAALAHLSRSLEIKRQLGDAEGMAIVQGNLGYLRIIRGELDAAAVVLTEAMETAHHLGLSYLLVQNQRLVGAMHVAAGDWNEALAVLEECVQRAGESGAQDQLADVYYLLGEAWLGAGQTDLANQWATKALQLMSGTHLLGPTEERGNLLRLLGMIAYEKGVSQRADLYLQESLGIFRNISNLLGEGRTLYQLGRLAVGRGDKVSARQLFEKAAGIFQRMGAKLDAQAVAKSMTDL
ncbi:MAG: tetratricopeptide repeat protein [Anaerolineales bacterium]|nr:tetratricopeptide repeat protein [Anaerolineales bacterium]